jgi:geranylgeranyl pyrophosphate synthase
LQIHFRQCGPGSQGNQAFQRFVVFVTPEGQAMELGWVHDNDLTVAAENYLRLVLKKTAWYSPSAAK